MNNLPIPTEGKHVLNPQISTPAMNAQFLGMTPQSFLEGVGLQKAENKNNKNPGAAGRPHALRSHVEPLYDVNTSKGIREKYRPLEFAILREIERKNPIVSAATNKRGKQLRPFANISTDENKPGFRTVLQDEERKPSSREKEEMQYLNKWFKVAGKIDIEGWEDRKGLQKVISQMSREYLTIDRIAIELRRNRKGDILDFWLIDGATIRNVVQSGYRGDRSDFDSKIHIARDTDFEKRINESRELLIPKDMSKIKYVQELEGRLTAAYTRQDLIVDQLQERVDVKYSGFPFPPLEQAMQSCAAFLFGMSYNAEAFNSGTLPKIALIFKDGNFSQEQLIALQDEFIANFQGIQGAWRIPMINMDAQVVDLYKSPRDMEYIKYLEFMTALICAVMGIDPQEIGLRVMQAQNVLSENQGARLQYSKNSGLNDQLGAIADVFNKLLLMMNLAEKYRFQFTGIEPEDREVRSKLDDAAVKRDQTVNELRAKKDLKPLKYGDILLDQAYIQYMTQKEMEGQQGEEGEEEEDEISNAANEVIDESVDAMFKARKINRNKIRTLLV